MRRRRLTFWTAVVLVTLTLAACSSASSNLGKYYQGRTLHLNVMEIKRLPELRYATIDPEQVVRHWRLVPSSQDLELVMLRLKVENHTAINAVLDVDQQAAQLRDMLRENYSPVDLPSRVFQDLRGQATVDVHVNQGQCFDPNQMYVTPGTTVNWINDGEQVQMVDLTPGGGESHAIGPGETYSQVFNETGTWDYECGAEGLAGQAARIIVEEEGDEPPPAERSMLFVYGPFELKKGMGIDGWMVFEAPPGAKLRDFRWRAGDSITITF